MNVDLRSLRYAVTVARALSFSRAADALGISQPALTRAIQSVEKEFGLRLFDRDRSGVTVTPDGERLIERANALLGEAADFAHMVEWTARGEEGRVAFGMAPFPASALLSSSLSSRIAASPCLANHAVVRDVHELSRLLLAGEIEFFLAAEQQVEDVPRIRRERLGIFPGALIVRAGHPLRTGEAGSARYPLLFAGAGGSGRRVENSIGAHILPQAHVIEDFSALRHIVAGTDAIMVGSIYSVLDEVRTGKLVILDQEEPTFTTDVRIELYWLDRRTRSHGALVLRDEFRRQIAQLERETRRLARSADQSASG